MHQWLPHYCIVWRKTRILHIWSNITTFSLEMLSVADQDRCKSFDFSRNEALQSLPPRQVGKEGAATEVSDSARYNFSTPSHFFGRYDFNLGHPEGFPIIVDETIEKSILLEKAAEFTFFRKILSFRIDHSP